MLPIFPPARRVLTPPTDFLWASARPAGTPQPNAPNVWVTGIAASLASIVGGEQFALSRGSTAQNNTTVTLTAPGAPPKTLTELVADINAVFGIAAGKPTDFAFAWRGGVRLVDKTVGLNTGLIEVVSYAGANETAKNALYNAIGLPIISRDQAAPPNVVRYTGVEIANDDGSCVSTNYLALTPEMTSVYVEVDAGCAGPTFADAPQPVVALAFSDGTVTYEPPLYWLTQYPGPEALSDPAAYFGAITKLGGVLGGIQAMQVGFFDSSIFNPGILPTPANSSRSGFEVPIPRMGATRVRAIALGARGAFATTTRYSPTVSMRAWGVGA